MCRILKVDTSKSNIFLLLKVGLSQCNISLYGEKSLVNVLRYSGVIKVGLGKLKPRVSSERRMSWKDTESHCEWEKIIVEYARCLYDGMLDPAVMYKFEI